jgi:hypothetical protein
MRRVADNSLTIRNQALSLDDLNGFSMVEAFSEENVPFSSSDLSKKKSR